MPGGGAGELQGNDVSPSNGNSHELKIMRAAPWDLDVALVFEELGVPCRGDFQSHRVVSMVFQ